MRIMNPYYVPTKDLARAAQKLDTYFRGNVDVPYVEAADLPAALGTDAPTARELATRRVFEDLAERLRTRVED